MNDLTAELLDTLGLEGFLKLTEAHAGTSLYVPQTPETSKLAEQIGVDNTARLSKAYAGGYIRVPLAREHRARRYREDGLNNSQIARRLGITESGVGRLFKRKPTARKASVSKQDPRQSDFFD